MEITENPVFPVAEVPEESKRLPVEPLRWAVSVASEDTTLTFPVTEGAALPSPPLTMYTFPPPEGPMPAMMATLPPVPEKPFASPPYTYKCPAVWRAADVVPADSVMSAPSPVVLLPVAMVTAPPTLLPEPDRREIGPPTPVDAVLAPDAMVTPPPFPVSVVPTDNTMEPAWPPVARPTRTETEPVLPELVVPVCRTMFPEAPDVDPPGGVVMNTLPLVPKREGIPPARYTAPPFPEVDVPATRDTEPPMATPEPPDTIAVPPTLPAAVAAPAIIVA